MEKTMEKTTVYLPTELKAKLRRVAEERGCSEAEIIRAGIRHEVERRTPPMPRGPLFDSGDPGLSLRVDELLKGFGEH